MEYVFRKAVTFGCVFGFVCISLFLSVDQVHAAVRTWDGEGGDGLWSTCTNWSGDVCPGSGDVATFDGTSDTASNIDAGGSFGGAVSGIDINIGYTSAISVTRSTLTIGNGNFVQDVGSFNGGSSTIDLNGSMTLVGGTFTATSGTMTISTNFTNSGGTFAHNNGTVNFDANAGAVMNINVTETFYNVLFSKTGGWDLTITSGDTMVVLNDLISTSGAGSVLNGISALIIVGGNISATTAFSNVPMRINGTGTQTWDLTGIEGEFDGDLTVNKSSGTLQFLSSIIMNVSNQDFTLTNGTVDLNGFGLTINNNGTALFTQSGGTFIGGSGSVNLYYFVQSGGTFNATSETMAIAKNWTHTAGGTFVHNNGLVEFGSSFAGTLDVNTSETFYNFSFAKTGGWALSVSSGDVIIIESDLNFSPGSGSNFNTAGGGAVVQVGGNMTVATSCGSVPITFNGTGTQTFTLTGVEASCDGDIVINKSSGSVELGSALTLNATNQDLTITEGSFDVSSYALTVNGSGSVFVVEDGGTFRLQGGETITTPTLNSGSTVTYDGTSGPYTVKDYSYHHLTFNGPGGTFNLGVAESIVGNLTLTTGVFDVNDQTMTIAGNSSINGGIMKTGTNTNTFGDGAPDTVTISNGSLEIESDDPTVDIIKNAGTWTNSGGTIIYKAATTISQEVLSALSPYNNLTVNSSGSTYVLDGALDINGNIILTAGTLDVSGSNFGMTVAGSWTDTGAGIFAEQAGTVTFDGTGTVNANEAFNDFIVNSAGVVTLGANLEVDDDVTISSGTLDVSASNYAITVGGDWGRGGDIYSSIWNRDI